MALVILILLILLNGVFALSEMAIVSSRPARLKAMADKGSLGAKTALRLLEDPSKMLSTVQTGITLITVISGAFGATSIADSITPAVARLAPALAEHSGAISLGAVMLFVSFLSLIFGELVPKRVALSAPEELAAATAPLMAITEGFASPVIGLLRWCTDTFIRLVGLHRTRAEDVTEEELQSLIDEGARAGVLEVEEREMIEGVMRLADRSVRTIMTPRTDIVWLDPDMTDEDILAAIRESGHSRFPVASGEANNMLGIVQTKDLLSHLAKHGHLDIRAVMHEPVYVPETVPVLRLLASMRGNPVRMVAVSDEYGALLGIVTAADLLESIAGDVALSEDEGLEPAVRRDDGSWLIDGMTPIDELGEVVGERIKNENEGYSTVAGLVMHILKAVPRTGDKAELWPLAFEVVDMDGRRIDKVIVRRLEPREDETG